MPKFLFLIFIQVLFLQNSFSQNEKEQLAAQYFANQEYDKASDLLEDLCKKQPENIYFYENLLQCYIQLKDYKAGEKLVDKRINKYEQNYVYLVDKGYILQFQGKNTEKDKIFEKIVNTKFLNESEVSNIFNAFMRRKYYDEALKTILNARKKLDLPYLMYNDAAELYFIKKEIVLAVSEIIQPLVTDEFLLKETKDLLAYSIKKNEDYDIVKKQLIKILQKQPNNIALNDLLIWCFTQQKNWEGAMIQSKAIDKRLNENGQRLIDLAWQCQDNENYKIAIECYTYVMQLGTHKPYYYQAQQGILRNGLLQIKQNNGTNQEELKVLENEYLSFIAANGTNWQTAQQLSELAELYIYYIHKPDEGIKYLQTAIKQAGIPPKLKAQCKLSLGDAYLMADDPWEADLLYKQVELDFNNDALGQEAKYRYARLCYYRGDFEWSQSQLDVLKSATSQLISNNAMQLWLLIQDNIGLDSTYEALTLFAKADLLLYQNRLSEATTILEEIPLKFPNHPLTDEIYFAKAQIAERQNQFKTAQEWYLKIINEYPTDILADNAIINLAKLYDFKWNDTAQAKKYYEKIILEYSNSLYIEEARKRFRILRGDKQPAETENYWE